MAAVWCSQRCEDVGDSYECKCAAGYRLTDDRHSCVAADGKLLPPSSPLIDDDDVHSSSSCCSMNIAAFVIVRLKPWYYMGLC